MGRTQPDLRLLFLRLPPCTGFLWLQEQTATDAMVYSNTDLFSNSSRGPKSEMGLTGLSSRCYRAALLQEAPEEDVFPGLFLGRGAT